MEEYTQFLSEGMSLDDDPSLQGENTYSYGLNGNLITKNGNNYSFESSDGTVLNWTMPLHKTGGTTFVPHGFIRMGDKLIVHSTDNRTTGGDGEIGIVTFNNAGVGTYNVLYYHSDLNYTLAHMIFGYGLEENDKFHRHYYTDDFNQPRTINTADLVFTTNIASGSLVVGQKYMVLTNSIGSITHNTVVYGPKQVAGNVFTAANTVYTTSGSVRVIKYVNANIFNYTPEKSIATINYVRYNYGGSIFCGVKLYTYRLSTVGGYVSPWSFTTNPIHVTDYNPTLGYQVYQGRGAGNTLVNSNKSIDLLIEGISLDFDKIQVAVIEIDEDYDVIRSSTIFFDDDITGESMTITHLGNEDLSNILIDDLELTTEVMLRIKDITTTKQRQIASNITTRGEFDFDTSAITVSPLIYTMPTDTEFDTTNGGLTSSTWSFDHGYCPSTGIVSGNILTGGHYVVRGTGSVTYNAVVYTVGETFVGAAGVYTFTVTSGVPIVKGCIRIQEYIDNTSTPVYRIIDLENDFFDYKSMAAHMYLKGRWRDETYRDGILFWDNFGNPYLIKWIKDTKMPSQSDISGTYALLGDDSERQFFINVLGVTLSNIDITDIKDNISGISIVRVKRDKTILGQGLILQNSASRINSLQTVPLSTVTPANDHHAAGNGNTLGYTWGLVGPEFDFDTITTFPIPLIEGDRLKPVADLGPVSTIGVHTNANSTFERVGLDEVIYSKFYEHNPYTTVPGVDEGHIDISFTIIPDGVKSLYDGSRSFFNKDIATAGFHPPAASAGSATSMQSKGASGEKRNVIICGMGPSGDFLNHSNSDIGTGVQGGTDMYTGRKLLANYTRPKNILYGGTSDQAKANSRYQFCGHYLKIDSTLLAAIFNSGSGRYVLNGLQVFGGDCFVNLYDRVNSSYNSRYEAANNFDLGGGTNSTGSYSWGLIFPCESEINVALREQRHMARDGMHNSSNGVVYNYSGANRLENFIYNPAYSTENDLVQYDALPVGFQNITRFPYMHRYSQFKNLGETIDNMRIFLIENFRNVDAMHGEINNVFVGGGRLFYLQRRGIGYIPIEERETAIGALGQAVQIGVGGVAQRYDTIDKFYGCQHQSGLIVLEDRFLFPDISRRSIISFGFSGNVEDTSIIKGVQSFLQNAFIPAEGSTNSILNIDQPILGDGVIGVYNPVNKTAYMTFKFSDGRAKTSPLDFTIGINAKLQSKFIGFFSFTPVIYTEINSRLYAVNIQRSVVSINTNYSVGDEVYKSGINYVCILAFSTGGSINANQQPDFGGSIYWVATSQENQIHRMFTGDVCKFFGIVYPYKIEIIANKYIDKEKVYDNCEVYGNNTAFTDVYYTNSRQTASDLNITSKNKNFRYIDSSWWFNIALFNNKERLVDKYLKVKLVVKNYLTNPTISLNTTKRIVYLKTIFRKKL